MMSKVILAIPPMIYKAIWSHLLPKRFRAEEVAFIFAQSVADNGIHTFRYSEWHPVQPMEFLTRSCYHLELTDETRARAIKRAHDLGASLVELHSHYGSWPAQFSASDLLGFREFVPHVWWRLKGRPYMAIVATRSGFDGIAWISDPKSGRHIDGIISGNLVLEPTMLSNIGDNLYDDIRTF